MVHKHDLGQPVRIKLELEYSPFASIEHLPINSYGANAVGGDFAGLDVPYIPWEFGDGPVPHGTLNQVGLELELRWSAQNLAPYLARWAVEFNGHPVAAISSVPEEGRAILAEFNFEHPLLAPELRDEDAPRPSPVETLLRELSREIAIHEAQPESAPIDTRVSVKTVFGALPDLEQELSFDLRDPDVSKVELEGKTPRAVALTALLSEFMLGPARIIRDYLARMTYIGPLREIPARDYIPQFSPDESRWARGLAAWDLLHGPRGSELIEKVNFWLFDEERLNSGYRLELIGYRKVPTISPINVILQNGVSDEDLVDVVPTLRDLLEQYPVEHEIRLRDIRTGALVVPSDVGVGLSQLIPVIVALVGGNEGLVAIEQPELHIHPAVQVGVGDLLATAATAQSSDPDAERCLLIETHSEHIMLRLLRRIRETSENELPPGAPSLTPNDVAVIYAEPTEDVLRLTPLRITPDGDFLDRWPRGFFQERGEELF